MESHRLPPHADELDFHPQDILAKTDKGNLESRLQTAQSALPRRLRTLLMVVDGKTPFHVFADTLANYGDVASLYEALEIGGYVTRLRQGAGAANRTSVKAPISEEAPYQPAPTRNQDNRMKPRVLARPGMDAHEFSALITEISTLLENKLGIDAMAVLMKLEQAITPQDLLDMLPELGKSLEPHLGSGNVKKFVSEIKRQLA